MQSNAALIWATVTRAKSVLLVWEHPHPEAGASLTGNEYHRVMDTAQLLFSLHVFNLFFFLAMPETLFLWNKFALANPVCPEMPK